MTVHKKRFTGRYAVFNKRKKPIRCLRCNKPLRAFKNRKTSFCNLCYNHLKSKIKYLQNKSFKK